MNLWHLVSPYVQVGDMCYCIHNGKTETTPSRVDRIVGWGPGAAVNFGGPYGYVRRDCFFKKNGRWYYYYDDDI